MNGVEHHERGDYGPAQGSDRELAHPPNELRRWSGNPPVWTARPDQHFPPGVVVRASAVLVLFGALDDSPASAPSSAVSRRLDVLLTQRAARMGHHPGQIAFPGGGIDPDDAGPEAAALREAQEETGLDPSGVEVLGRLYPLPLAASHNLVTPVIGWWARPSQVAAVDPAEAVSVFRAPVADLVDPCARRTWLLRRAGRTLKGPAFLVGDRVVWGFTAYVLDRAFADLGWDEPWDRSETVDVTL